MRKKRRKMWEIDIGMKIDKKDVNINRFHLLINKSIDIMQTKAENTLNPLKHELSGEAKKRLKWLYLIHYECSHNISKAARKIGISRTWLSQINSVWENSGEDPRSLEPESKAPNNTDHRKRINDEIENKIIEVRKKYHWGKDKLTTILARDHNIQVGSSTINRYNYVRPHQALGNLTPIEFYELWKNDPNKAYRIAEKWKAYLKKQSKRLANSRKIKNRKKIAKLMQQIDKKLANSYS
jgi:hypothetical protein